MGKIIYLISLLGNLKIILFLAIIILLGLEGMLIFMVNDSKEQLDWYMRAKDTMTGNWNEKIESEDKKLKRNSKNFKIVSVLFSLCLLISILIPKKEEMYMIAMTKDYEVQDIYNMSKNELKSSIDYFFKKVDELRK